MGHKTRVEKMRRRVIEDKRRAAVRADADSASMEELEAAEAILDRETGVRYPKIQVELLGGSGNAYAILGGVTKALRRAKVGQEEIDLFKKEATSGDYDHLLATAMRWVDVV